MNLVDFLLWSAEMGGWRFDPRVEAALAELVDQDLHAYGPPLWTHPDLDRRGELLQTLGREVFAAFCSWSLGMVERWIAEWLPLP